MLESEIIEVDSKTLLGIKIALHDAPVLMLVGKKGFVGCGYFNVSVADKVSHSLAVVSGVKSFSDMLSAKVQSVSQSAAELGIQIGMSGIDAAKILA